MLHHASASWDYCKHVRCRFYIMRLPGRGLAFDRITYHGSVTQCLGGLGEQPWYMAVAKPTASLEAWPQLSDLQAFRCFSIVTPCHLHSAYAEAVLGYGRSLKERIAKLWSCHVNITVSLIVLGLEMLGSCDFISVSTASQVEGRHVI